MIYGSEGGSWWKQIAWKTQLLSPHLFMEISLSLCFAFASAKLYLQYFPTLLREKVLQIVHCSTFLVQNKPVRADCLVQQSVIYKKLSLGDFFVQNWFIFCSYFGSSRWLALCVKQGKGGRGTKNVLGTNSKAHFLLYLFLSLSTTAEGLM